MQKQRSPYTGGGFNLQQLKATTFGKNETLNGMPFLVQLAHQVQQRPLGHQHMASPPTHMMGNAAGGNAAGHERGLRSGTPRSYLNTSSGAVYNGSYEGEMMPPLSLGVANSSSPLADDCLHKANMSNMSNISNMNNMSNTSNMSNMNNMSNVGNVGQSGNSEQSAQPPPIKKAKKGYQNDTDSETEYCQHMQSFETGQMGQNSRWRRFFDYLKARMPPQRQERMEAVLQRCCESSFFNHVLLVLQLFSILIGGAIMQGLCFCMNVTQLSFCLWRCKFQLRIWMRTMLWRMANAKGNDALVFLGVMLVAPWLFLVSLIGFAISFMFHFKEGLGATLRQMRLQMLN